MMGGIIGRGGVGGIVCILNISESIDGQFVLFSMLRSFLRDIFNFPVMPVSSYRVQIHRKNFVIDFLQTKSMRISYLVAGVNWACPN